MKLIGRFAFGGLILGAVCGIGVVLYVYLQAPSMPGIEELIMNILIVGALAFLGAAVGSVVGLLASILLAAGARLLPRIVRLLRRP